MTERVMLFIDWENLRGSMATVLGAANVRVDVKKLLDVLTEGRKLVRAYVYTAVPSEDEISESQHGFLTALRRTDYVELRLGQLKKTPDGKVYQKGVDVRIALDMLRLGYQNAYDTAVLVSGDGDLVEVVRLIRDLGKTVELAYFDDSVSRDLLDNVDKRRQLDVHCAEALLPGQSRSALGKAGHDTFG